MKIYRIYVNEQGWNMISKVNSEKQASIVLNKLDEREVHSLVIEHDTDTKTDTPCTYKIRMKYLNK